MNSEPSTNGTEGGEKADGLEALERGTDTESTPTPTGPGDRFRLVLIARHLHLTVVEHLHGSSHLLVAHRAAALPGTAHDVLRAGEASATVTRLAARMKQHRILWRISAHQAAVLAQRLWRARWRHTCHFFDRLSADGTLSAIELLRAAQTTALVPAVAMHEERVALRVEAHDALLLAARKTQQRNTALRSGTACLRHVLARSCPAPLAYQVVRAR